MNQKITREKILANAITDVYREMFAKAQPMADYDALIEEYKAGKIDIEKDKISFLRTKCP